MAYNARFNDDNGGGFMQGTPSNTQSPGGKARPEQTLRPVTIKQLLDADIPHGDGTASIQDIDLIHVSFCAVVRDIERNPTNVLLKVEDGTGAMEVRKWIESSDGETEGLDPDTGVQEHDWVRVIGAMKFFNSKRHVGATKIQKIVDFNQINYHLLDAIRVTLEYERGPPGGTYMAVDHTDAGTTPAKVVMPQHQQRPPKQAKIMDILTTGSLPEEGMNVADIARLCGLSFEEAAEEADKLKQAGEIFTTVDEDHYMPTNT